MYQGNINENGVVNMFHVKESISFSILSILLMALLVPFMGYQGADAQTINFEKHYYDPIDDTQIAAQEGQYVHGSQWKDLDIVEMDLRSETGGLVGQTTTIHMAITVDGIINDGNEYIYGAYLSVGNTDYFLGYKEKAAVGFNMKTGNAVVPTYDGIGTDTITFSIGANQIGNPTSAFKWHALTVKRTDTKNYGDIAPNKLVKITDPWDRQTVFGAVTIRGETRETTLTMEKVEIQIDSKSSGGWEEVDTRRSADSWSYDVDTTALGDGDHTINVKATDTTGLEFDDSIDINVDTNSALEPATTDTKPDFSIGDSYNFEISQSGNDEPEIISIDISTQSTMEIKLTKKDQQVEGKDCWELSSEQIGSLYVGNIEFDFETSGKQYLDQSNSDVVKEFTEVTLSSDLTQEETQQKTTIYDPPKVKYQFPLEVTGEWSDTTTADIDIDGASSTESLNIKNRCIFSEDTSVPGGSFETFAVRTQYQEATFYKVEYYSPELGYPVRIETFDIDDNLIGVLVLSDYSIKDTFLTIKDTLTMTNPDGDELSTGDTKTYLKQEATITLEVENTGTGTANDAYVVGYVKLADESEDSFAEFDTNTLRIKGGETETVELIWAPETKGTYEFMFKAYSDEASTEIYDSELSFTNDGLYLNVYEKQVSSSGESILGLSTTTFIIIVSAVIVLVIVIIVMKKRSSNEEVLETTEEEEAEVVEVVVADGEEEDVETAESEEGEEESVFKAVD